MQKNTTTTKRCGPLTPWELPTLLTPVHTYRRVHKKMAQDRPHFAAVLAYIQRNRFVVASQVQRRFPDRFRSARTVRRHLEEMESLGYIATAPTRSVSPLFPKVFYVTGRGVRKLTQALADRGTSWESPTTDRRSRNTREGYSAEHVMHELFITELLLAVWQTTSGRPDLELLTMQRRLLAKHPAFQMTLDGCETRLQPDAMFLFRQINGGMVCCFLEIDTGTMNLKQIEEKYRRYAAWAQAEAGQSYLIDLYRRHGATDPRPNFRVVFVADDRTGTGGYGRMVDLYAAASKHSRALQDRLWFTSVGELRSHQSDASPLAAPVWRRGRDCKSLPRLESQPNARTKGRRVAGRSGLAQVFAELPLHPLFPLLPEIRPIESAPVTAPGHLQMDPRALSDPSHPSVVHAAFHAGDRVPLPPPNRAEHTDRASAE